MAQAKSQYIIEIELVDGQAQAKLNGVSVSLKDVDRQLKNVAKTSSQAAKANQQFNKTNQDMISSSGLAGATLVEFGRFVSDLPFGITAVTNNLSQLSTLFVTLIAKTDGATGAIKLLLKQLKGPLGFILIFQVVISLIQAYQKEIIGFIKGTDDANEATKKLNKSVKDLGESLEDNNEKFKDREKIEKNLNKIRELVQEYEDRSLQAQKTGNRLIDVRIKRLSKLGIEVDKNRIKEDGYIESLLRSNKTAQEISQELEDRRIQLSVDRIIGRLSAVELAQGELELFIATQEELNVKKEDYIKSEEYRTLQAKLFKAELDARKAVVASVLQAEGLQGLGVVFSLEETELQKEARKELQKGTEDRASDVQNFLLGEQKRLNALVKTDKAKKKISDEDRSRRNEDLRALAGQVDRAADLFGEQTAANKGMRVASATIDTYAAADTALATLPPPLSFIAAAATIAAGLANVQQILSVRVPKEKAAPAAARGGAGRVIQAPDFNIVGASETSQLAETVAGQQAKPVRAFVVGKDISSQQELDRNISKTASI